MPHITLPLSVINEVRERVEQMKADERLTDAQIAETVDCSVDSMQKWRTGTNVSTAVTLKVLKAYPRLGVIVNCPCCGKRLFNELA